MKFLFYSLWMLSTVVILITILFNHYAEFYLHESALDMLFNQYSKQWAYFNANITIIWSLLTCIGMFRIGRGK